VADLPPPGALQYISQVFSLTDRLRERGRGVLTPAQYHQMLFAFFWLHRDTGRLQEVVDAMARDGHPLDRRTATYLLHIYCHAAQWGEALRTLDTFMSGEEAAQDDVWHVVCRNLVWKGADVDVVKEFMARMDPATQQRFQVIYSLNTEREKEHVTVIEGAEEEVVETVRRRVSSSGS
jgi:hypothetical protein